MIYSTMIYEYYKNKYLIKADDGSHSLFYMETSTIGQVVK